MAKGPVSLIGKISGLGPHSIVRNLVQADSRFFRMNEGSTDYATIPEVSPDRIVMLVYPVNGNTGLPSGAPSVTDNVFQIIDFSFSGTINQIGLGFEGIIANVQMFVGDTLIRDYPINDNSNVLRDRVSGEDGAVVNGNYEDWGLFTQQSTGEWLGEELITQQAWENPPAIGSEWSFSNNRWSLAGSGALSVLGLILPADQPDVMRVEGNVVLVAGGDLSLNSSGTVSISDVGQYSVDVNSADNFLYKRRVGAVSATIDRPSVKEVLNVS